MAVYFSERKELQLLDDFSFPLSRASGQTPKRRTFKYGGHDSILRTRDPNVIVEEFEEAYELSDSILHPYDADDLDNSISSDVSAATADSGRPGSRAASRDPVAIGGARAALKQINL